MQTYSLTVVLPQRLLLLQFRIPLYLTFTLALLGQILILALLVADK